MNAVAVIGATGRTGLHIVTEALRRGHLVTAVARHPEQLLDATTEHWCATGQLRTATADVRDPAALTAAVADANAAISAIASPGRRPDRLFSDGTRNIITALHANQVERFVCISSRGVNGHDPNLPMLYRRVIRPLFLRELYTDMQQMEDHVRGSDLQWTLIRGPRLTDGPAQGTYRVADGHNPPGGWTLSRADLAAFAVDQLNTPAWIRRAPTPAY